MLAAIAAKVTEIEKAEEIWGVRQALSETLINSSRAQSTGAIHGRNQPCAINHAQLTTHILSAACPHNSYTLKSPESLDFAIQITMVWASDNWRRNRSGESVRISNINIVLFAKPNLASKCELRGALRARPGPPEF